MAYSTGILNKRVILAVEYNAGKYGKTGSKTTYTKVADVWADVTWTKGVKAMREGALDAYDTVMVRTRFNRDLTRNSFLGIDGVIFQIQSFHADYHENTIQITAVETVMTVPYSDSVIDSQTSSSDF